MLQRRLKPWTSFPGEVSEMANCRKICVYKDICSKAYPDFSGSDYGERPHVECPMAWNIEDKIMDKLPFEDDDYDGPEVEEL